MKIDVRVCEGQRALSGYDEGINSPTKLTDHLQINLKKQQATKTAAASLQRGGGHGVLRIRYEAAVIGYHYN